MPSSGPSGLPLARSPRELFDGLVEHHRDRIRRHVLGLVRNPADAEDLTQETFLRAHRQLGGLREPAALGVWLYRIATHVSYDFLRRAARGPAPAPEGANDEPALSPRLDELVDQRAMSACVQEFLDRLPTSYRAAVLLHDLHGLTSTEIASLLGCTPGTAKIRLHRARAVLRAALQGGCELSRDERGVLVCGRKLAGS
jgi:RNA polymerase sigma-70 factor (ECF subfamily)